MPYIYATVPYRTLQRGLERRPHNYLLDRCSGFLDLDPRALCQDCSWWKHIYRVVSMGWNIFSLWFKGSHRLAHARSYFCPQRWGIYNRAGRSGLWLVTQKTVIIGGCLDVLIWLMAQCWVEWSSSPLPQQLWRASLWERSTGSLDFADISTVEGTFSV